MNETAHPLAQRAIQMFTVGLATGASPADAAMTVAVGYRVAIQSDDDIEAIIARLTTELVAYSDAQGFNRDAVFGPRQRDGAVAGPKVHKLAQGLRDLCREHGYDIERTYRVALDCLAAEPKGPSI